MHAMESPERHINRMVGMPWVKGSDDPKNGGVDCWGAVYYSFKCIDVVTLPDVFNRAACDLDSSAQSGLSDYEELDSAVEGCLFCCFDQDDVMIHIGRVLLGQAYHATGSEEKAGQVSLWKLSRLEQVYTSGGGYIKYYQYKGAK